MNIGNRLKEVRKGKANQKQIADLLNITQQQISECEQNIQEIPCRHIILLQNFLTFPSTIFSVLQTARKNTGK